MKLLFTGCDQTQIVTLTKDREVGNLIQLFETIAQEEGWQPGEQLRAYQQQALHLGVMMDGTLVGGLQALPGRSIQPLPCQVLWPDASLPDLAHTLHITMMALAKHQRGHARLFWPLCVELWRHCDCQDIHTLLLEATPPTLHIYRRLGWPLEVIGELRPHWGEDCFLCQMGVQQVAEALTQKAEYVPSYRALLQQATCSHDSNPA